ncbi:MAG: hypothetical protein ACYTFZ_07770 [Planctomycetota bacterium]|jgi:hypothetical protein
MKESTQNIERLRRRLSRDDFRQLGDDVWTRMGRSKPAQDAPETFSMAQFVTDYNTISPANRRLLWGSDPQRLRAMDSLVELADLGKKAEKYTQGSPTARHLQTLETLGLPFMVLMGSPAALPTAGILAGTTSTAALLTSPRYLSWLGEAVPLINRDPTATPKMLSRLLVNFAGDPLEDAARQYVNTYVEQEGMQ